MLISVSDGKATASLRGLLDHGGRSFPPSTGWLCDDQLDSADHVHRRQHDVEPCGLPRARTARSANSLTSVATVNNAGIASYVVEGLPPGVWYFAVTAYTSDGAESDQSVVANATVLLIDSGTGVVERLKSRRSSRAPCSVFRVS